MNLYVVLLEKFAKLHADCYQKNMNPDSSLGSWVVFGHFDAMHASRVELKGQSIFKAIQENNKRPVRSGHEGSYFYPLYLISENNDDDFWRNKSSYRAVIRIHFSDSIRISDKIKRIKEILNKKRQGTKCEYRLYKTVELSDIVLSVFADKMSSLLEFVLTIRTIGEIGRVYSYCGIRYNALADQSWRPASTDSIDYLSMRFSVSDFTLFMPQLRIITHILNVSKWQSVVGVDDILVTKANLPIRQFVELFRQWFVYKEEDSNVTWGEGISGVTTRVGISREEDLFSSQATQQGRLALNELCNNQIEKFKQLVECLRGNRTKRIVGIWLHPLRELVNNLVRVSNTVVLDEFAYLLLPGVKAFLDNTLSAATSGIINDADCCSFVENWAHLMEHIMRSEGQLSHQPELRPVIYSIPITMFEYTLAFLAKVSDLLQKNDAETFKVSFFLVPRLCNKLEADELYSAKKGNPIGLVLVTIPLEKLSKPNEVLQELCHEISHFAGEEIRNRQIRQGKFAYSSAAILAHELFHTIDPPFVECINTRLKGIVVQESAKEMLDAVEGWIEQYGKDRDLRDDLIREIVTAAAKEKWRVKLSPDDIPYNAEKTMRAQALLHDLLILYRECFADMCMLTILPQITTENYIKSLVDELEREELERKRIDEKFEQFAIRICVSLYATGKPLPNRNSIYKYQELYQECMNIQNGLEQECDEYERRFPITSIYHLLEYVKVCNSSLCKQLENDSQGSTIQEMFSNVTSNPLDYDYFLNVIDRYRCDTLGIE